MDMKAYGVCFKLKGGPDLLDYIQTNEPVPVEVMGQVMNQMGQVSAEDLAFAERLIKDWKKVFNESVPLIMNMMSNGGYEIDCNVPDELLEVTRLLTGKENETLIEEYTAHYLKTVCGVDTTIISVDLEKDNAPAEFAEQSEAEGFDAADLFGQPEEPAFEDVAMFMNMDFSSPKQSSDVYVPERVVDGPAKEAEEEFPEAFEPEDKVEEEFPKASEPKDVVEDVYEEPEDDVDDVEDVEDIYEDDILDDVEVPDIYEDEVSDDVDEVPEEPVDEQEQMKQALAGIYADFVGNIKSRRLDERLGLRIGQ